VQWPHRALHAEADQQQHEREHLRAVAEAVAVVAGERRHVERAGAGVEQQEPDQHQPGSEQCEQDELGRCRTPSGPAPHRDEEVHRDEDDLEEHEEQHEVECDERAEHADLEQQREREEQSHRPAVGDTAERVGDAQKGEQCRQHDQRQADSVDAEVEPHVDAGQPLPVHGVGEAAGVVVGEPGGYDDSDHERRSGYGECDPCRRPIRKWERGQRERAQRGNREQQWQPHRHRATASDTATTTASTPTTRPLA
jgi:hypothetical protein